MTRESAKGSSFFCSSRQETSIRNAIEAGVWQACYRKLYYSSKYISPLSVFATHKSTKGKRKNKFWCNAHIFRECTLCTHLAKCTLWRHWSKYTHCTQCTQCTRYTHCTQRTHCTQFTYWLHWLHSLHSLHSMYSMHSFWCKAHFSWMHSLHSLTFYCMTSLK